MPKKIYLPGLNGLRTIAAIAVIISHIGLSLNYYGFENKGGYSLASFGVTIFFTLSGFLITYLLLVEKKRIDTIKIKKFYYRRLLRIWPLYFFYIIIVFITLQPNEVSKEIWYYVLMLPNIPFAANAAGGVLVTIPFLAHYWSLGVEEQFYLFWPVFIKKTKNIFLFLILFAFGFLILKLILRTLDLFYIIQVFLHYTRFGCLAIGGIGAFIYVNYNNHLLYLNNKILESFAWFVLLLVGINKFHLFSIIDHEIISLITLVIIFNQINNKRPLISLENRVFDYLGKISFGLYVYNPLVIYYIAYLFNLFETDNTLLKLILVYLINLISIIIVSHLSYFYFEKRFLKLKNKYTVVKSASNAREAN